MPVRRSSPPPDADPRDPFGVDTAFSEPPSLDDQDIRALPIEAFPRRRGLMPLVLFFAALALVGYFVFTAMDGLVNTNALDARVASLSEEIDDLEWQAEQLEALVSFLDSDEYIERVAREELGLVRVGEEAFAIQAPLRPGIDIARSPWWANLLPHPPDSTAEPAPPAPTPPTQAPEPAPIGAGETTGDGP